MRHTSFGDIRLDATRLKPMRLSEENAFPNSGERGVTATEEMAFCMMIFWSDAWISWMW
jgi:hypothetical protein